MDTNAHLKVENARGTSVKTSPVRRQARGPDGGGATGEEVYPGGTDHDGQDKTVPGAQPPSLVGSPPANSEPAASEGSSRQAESTQGMAIRRHMAIPRAHCDSITLNYYGDSLEVRRMQEGISQAAQPSRDETLKKTHTKQSRRLPHWVWYALAKSLGIKLHATDKPIFGTLMHMVTLFFAFGFSITNAWYITYDIVSNQTKQTVMTGTVTIMMGCFWSALSVYANKLAGKLFMNSKFVDSVRLHTKTIFKMNAAMIMIVLSTAVIGLNFVSSAKTFEGLCETVGLPVMVCRMRYILRVGCSIMALLWNLLVGIILLSVCRTHTIGIRRFIRELEEDGRIYELYRRGMSFQGPFSYGRGHLYQDDNTGDDDSEAEPEISPESDEYPVFPKSYPSSTGFPVNHCSPPLTPTRRISSRHTSQTSAQSQHHDNVATLRNSINNHAQTHQDHQGQDTGSVDGDVMQHAPPDKNKTDENQTDNVAKGFRLERRPIIIVREGSVQTLEDMDHISLKSEQEPVVAAVTVPTTQHLIQPDPPSQASWASRSSRSQMESPMNSTRVELGSPRQIPSSVTGDGTQLSFDNLSMGPHVLSKDEILLRYWKISCRLRATSLALQRWLMAIVMFVILWSVTFIVYWVKHETTIIGILQFTIPIFILPLICSAYGEVNFEGRRMLRCICPTDERMDMMFFLQQQPLEINAFGFAINYSTIVTALAGLGLALSTRLILDEINM